MARVVIVDDNMFIRALLREILSAPPHEVVGEAANGELGLGCVRKLRPQVVTLDLVMPGMTGLDTLADLLLIDPSLVVLVCSASLDQAKVIEALRIGAKGFIVKPFDRETVLSAIGEALEYLRGAQPVPEVSSGIGRPLVGGVEDQREFVRVSAALPIVVNADDGRDPIDTVTVDLSGSGILLAVGSLALGTTAGFRLDLGPDQPPIYGRAHVVRVTPAGQSALAFEQISIADHERYIDYINAHQDG